MIVAASGIGFSYPGTDKPTLTDVNLSVPAGGALGLMGLNGAGKTTLLKLICGVLEPSQGSLHVLGSAQISHDAHAKSGLGVMHQKLTFDMMLPAIENLKISARLHGKRWSAVRSKAADLCSRFSLDEGTLRQVTYTLSGGQMRRLQLVRAVLYEPHLLVVDEPTTGLDVVGRKALWSYLADLRAAGTTLLMCSHYADEVEAVCDGVVVLDHGRVAVQGTAEEVRDRYAVSSLEDAFLAAVGHAGTGAEDQG